MKTALFLLLSCGLMTGQTTVPAKVKGNVCSCPSGYTGEGACVIIDGKPEMTCRKNSPPHVTVTIPPAVLSNTFSDCDTIISFKGVASKAMREIFPEECPAVTGMCSGLTGCVLHPDGTVDKLPPDGKPCPEPNIIGQGVQDTLEHSVKPSGDKTKAGK